MEEKKKFTLDKINLILIAVGLLSSSSVFY